MVNEIHSYLASSVMSLFATDMGINYSIASICL